MLQEYSRVINLNIPLNIQVKGNPKGSQNNWIEAMFLSLLSNIFIIKWYFLKPMNLTFLGCGGEIVKYNIKTVRTLVTDNKKNFRVGEDIAFTLFNKVTNHHDHYIGNIVEMTDTSIKISNIEIDRYREDGEMIIDLENIESNSCNYVYYD